MKAVRPRIIRKSPVGKKFACFALAVILGMGLMCPVQALAATDVTVDGTTYKNAHSTETWGWDGKDDMTLNNFEGGKIKATGDLVITLSGDNSLSDSKSPDHFASISTQNGDLTIKSKSEDDKGTLTINSDMVTNDHAAITSGGDLTFENVDISASNENVRLDMNNMPGELTVTNSRITGFGNMGAPGKDTTITGSVVNGGSIMGKNMVISGSDIQSNNTTRFDHAIIATSSITLKDEKNGKVIDYDYEANNGKIETIKTVDTGDGPNANLISSKNPAFYGSAFTVLDGDGSTYGKDSKESFAVRGSGSLESFKGAFVDGKLVAPENYTLTEGSTIVTFKPEFLASLSNGEHVVILNWTNGATRAVINVADTAKKDDKTAKADDEPAKKDGEPAKAEDTTKTEVKATSSATSASNDNSVPKTDDSAYPFVICGMCVLALAVMCVSKTRLRSASKGKHVRR